MLKFGKVSGRSSFLDDFTVCLSLLEVDTKYCNEEKYHNLDVVQSFASFCEIYETERFGRPKICVRKGFYVNRKAGCEWNINGLDRLHFQVEMETSL